MEHFDAGSSCAGAGPRFPDRSPDPDTAPASPQGPEPTPSAKGLPADLGLADLRRPAQVSVAWPGHGYLALSRVLFLTSWPV